MANIEHKDVVDPDRHEPKGASTAAVDTVYVSNGAASGTWQRVDGDMIDSTGKNLGKPMLSNGAGKGSFDVAVWKDLIGDVTPKTSGIGAPSLNAFRGGNIRGFAYGAGDDGDMQFHLPHDYKLGTDIYIHLHWAHNGTAISGNLVTNLFVSYAKGHSQEIFPAEIAPSISVATPDIATIPRYMHRIEEIQLSAASPSVTQLDSDLLEPDGLIIIHYDVTTIPTITGGSPNEPFIFFMDIHYQADMIGTLNKAPNFYS